MTKSPAKRVVFGQQFCGFSVWEESGGGLRGGAANQSASAPCLRYRSPGNVREGTPRRRLNESLAYTTMLTSIRSYLAEMNVSLQLADEMLRTPPSSVRYLSAKEQEKFGLSVIDPIELETTSLAEAQNLGLDRREYNRREALAIQKCPRDAGLYDCHGTVMKSGNLPLLDFSQFGTPVE
jgi:hypothetical protein